VTIIFFGLPSAGKTTFLAALWHAVEYNGIDASLTVEKLEGDREHLNDIRSCWLRCEPQRRTSTSSETAVTMWRSHPESRDQTVAQVLAQEQPRLLPLPAHPFDTDLMRTVVTPRCTTPLS
jgi:hypothetical protein